MGSAQNSQTDYYSLGDFRVLYCSVIIHLYCAHCSAHQSEAPLLTRLSGADAVVLQSNCVRRTSSRSLHSDCLGRGSNPCSTRYRAAALTNRPPCRTRPTQPSYSSLTPRAFRSRPLRNSHPTHLTIPPFSSFPPKRHSPQPL